MRPGGHGHLQNGFCLACGLWSHRLQFLSTLCAHKDGNFQGTRVGCYLRLDLTDVSGEVGGHGFQHTCILCTTNFSQEHASEFPPPIHMLDFIWGYLSVVVADSLRIGSAIELGGRGGILLLTLARLQIEFCIRSPNKHRVKTRHGVGMVVRQLPDR